MRAFLEQEDNAFAWRAVRTDPEEGLTWHELELASQRWRGQVWRHELLVAAPTPLPHPETMLLFIAGGSNEEETGAPRRRGRHDWQAVLVGQAARASGAPAALLRQVPRQPILGGLHEDAAISFTMQEYLDGHPAERILLFPMVKSAVRAMDALQEFGRQAWDAGPERFVVSGASKRGWTAWLAGARDPRVAAIAPMVIDLLNLEAHLELQHAHFGSPSPMIRDYTEKGLHEAVATEAGRRLLTLVDPYAYREALTLPILILLGTNDPYWPVNAVRLYFDDLPTEDKFIHYTPNAGHDLNKGEDAAPALTAFFGSVVRNEPQPTLDWSLHAVPGGVRLRLRPGTGPADDHFRGAAFLWSADAPTRDFRESRWQARPLRRREWDRPEGLLLPAPREGYRALYAAFDLPGAEGTRHRRCTRVWVLGPEGPAD